MRIGFQEAVESWSRTLYSKIRDLGAGGSSDVYLMSATNGPHQGISFAVKVFKKTTEDNWRIDFMREIHFLRTCEHPAIVRVFDEGVHRDRFPFFVMEHLPHSLSRLMRDADLCAEEKIDFAVQLLSALDSLSRLNPQRVHRDIKPTNIFMKGDSCFLGDFGLQMPLGMGKRRFATAEPRLSTPRMARNYRSPELVAYHNGGDEPPPKSDVFQLGLVLAEMFTGENPLVADRVDVPLRLNPLQNIPGPFGAAIRSLIQSMLIMDTEVRPTADMLLDLWQGIYFEFLKPKRGGRMR